MSDNELIARFMGAEFVRKPHIFYPDQYTETYIFKGHPGNWRVEKEVKSHLTAPILSYHTDWDWLMPVVEKIEETMLQVSIHTAYTNVCGELNGIKYNQDSCFESQQETKIDVTYRAVLRFIKWYNQNPTQP